MNPRSTLGGGTLVALALGFIGLTVLFNYALRGWRLDLTHNHLYTTAPGTERILAGIKEPINLYLFFSAKTAQQLPQLATYGVRVREFLEELAARSNGKLHLHVIDPQPFSEDEDRASELGVRGAPLGASGGQFYFGLAGTNSTDGRAAIEFFDPNKEQFLEYDVVKLLYELANPKKPVVAWLSSLPMGPGFDPQSGQMREPWAVYSEAQQLFDLRPLDSAATKIDDDVSVLVLVHPKNLSPATQFAIDQYALRGGHILAFVDPLAEADSAGADPQNPMARMTADKASHLEPLLHAWGVAVQPGASSRRSRPRAVGHSAPGGGAGGALRRCWAWTRRASRPTTWSRRDCRALTSPWPGYLEPVKGSKVRFEPLLQSSTDAALLPVERFRVLMDPGTLARWLQTDRQALHPRRARQRRCVERVSRRSARGCNAARGGGRREDFREAPEPHRVCRHRHAVRQPVGACAEFLRPDLLQAWASNGDLVQNALDNLSGSDRPHQRARPRRVRAPLRARGKTAARGG